MAVAAPGDISGAGTTWQQQVSYYSNLLNEQYPGQLTGEQITLAQSYVKYMTAHTSADPATVFYEVVTGLEELQAVPADIAGAISAGVTKLGGVEKSIGPAAGAAAQQVNSDLGGLPSWLGGLGGSLASGLEGGVVQILKDIWNVIAGPVLVLLGLVILIVVIVLYFKNDIAALGGAAAGAAVAA